MQEDTICSISTPIGKGAIAIVRMSGKNSLKIAQSLFLCEHLKKEIIPRYMYFGNFQLLDAFEQCLMVYFKAPYSYTGEDIVEFQIHGGVLLAQKILNRLIESGARLAEAGEFSKRAFLNGKVTLDKAEAIIGEIDAESESELKTSLKVTNGELSKKISDCQDKLKTILAELEVSMDYPEETDETALKTDIFGRLEKISDEISMILENSESLKYIKNGIKVALVGKTNVGKSSIMNALLGENRAIVTDVKGTTRDEICESFLYKGIKINLIDTAGIRKTNNKVENLGIERSKKTLENADLVLFVMDASENKTKEDEEIEKLIKSKNYIKVINKTDKKRLLEKQDVEIEISALENKNIEKLKEKIFDMVISKEIDFNSVVLTNERQSKILRDANDLLKEITDEKFEMLDILSMKVKKVWNLLGKITGNTENEDIIDLIFSKFCLGK